MYALVSFFSGLLFTAAFSPFDYWYAAFISLTALAWVWLHAPTNRTVRYGFLFGLGNFGSGVYWVYISLYRFGNAPLIFAILANVLLVLYLALYPALVGYVLRRLSAPRTVYRLLLIPLLWLGAEFLRAYFLTGFPWLSAAYSQLYGVLNGFVPIFGVFGTGLFLLLICTLFAYTLSQRVAYPTVIAGFIVAIALVSRELSFTHAIGQPFSVALVQGNASQYTKFDAEHMQKDMEDYIALSAARSESVIIWPETAVAFMEESIKAPVLEPLDALFKDKRQAVVLGIPSGNIRADYYNSVITLGAANGRYAKNHLLPFGEFIPFKPVFQIFSRFVDMPLGDFSRGGSQQAPIFTQGVPATVSICFESAFGRQVRQGVANAQYLINVSNDGWFQGSIAAHQHLQMSQMRALELGREMARATSTGITVFIDSQGKILSSLPQHEQAVLSGWIQPRIGLTPYARFGNTLFISLWLLYAIIAALLYPMRKNHARAISSEYY